MPRLARLANESTYIPERRARRPGRVVLKVVELGLWCFLAMAAVYSRVAPPRDAARCVAASLPDLPDRPANR